MCTTKRFSGLLKKGIAMSAISVTYFDSPFLFFYYHVSTYESLIKNVLTLQNELKSYIKKKDVSYQYKSYKEYHPGQYVAVNHDGAWLRGIVDRIQTVWLIDYGKKIDMHVNKELCELPESFQKMPSMIMRGSLQYIVPLQKNVGEILIELEYGETVKVSEELCRRKWGIRDAEHYLKNLNIFYTPVPTLAIALTGYIMNKCDSDSCSSGTASASTLIRAEPNQKSIQGRAKDAVNLRNSSQQVVNISKKEDGLYLTREELIKMQNKFVFINGRKFDVVTVLNNKIADFNMAFKYANFDEISIGRACRGKHRLSTRPPNIATSEAGIFRSAIKFITKENN